MQERQDVRLFLDIQEAVNYEECPPQHGTFIFSLARLPSNIREDLHIKPCCLKDRREIIRSFLSQG